MKKRTYMTMMVIGIFITGIIGPVLAQDLIVFPAKGQSQKQLERDKFECYSWAKGQTGFDPMETPIATTPPPPQNQGSTGKSAVRGAAGGALVGLAAGSFSGNAGRGAAIGAASGGTLGAMRSRSQRRQSEQAQQQWADQQAGQYMQKRDTYNRANSACLEGKGYTVK
jgi:hypothetical protein